METRDFTIDDILIIFTLDTKTDGLCPQIGCTHVTERASGNGSNSRGEKVKQ